MQQQQQKKTEIESVKCIKSIFFRQKFQPPLSKSFAQMRHHYNTYTIVRVKEMKRGEMFKFFILLD